MVILIKSVFLVLVILFLLGFLIGTISPKMTQWLVSSVDQNILASSMGALNTILVVSAPMMTAIITTFASINLNLSLYILLGVSLIILVVVSKVALTQRTVS
ncbi:MAG: hypothetical protein L0I02_04170 [Lactobacillus sp.]|nr:hypothetical protein [Lactobacillus sp.]MDN6052557.1 hypothetical protein [Lactobacillus sp.]